MGAGHWVQQELDYQPEERPRTSAADADGGTWIYADNDQHTVTRITEQPERVSELLLQFLRDSARANQQNLRMTSISRAWRVVKVAAKSDGGDMHHTPTMARNRFGIMSSLLCLAALSLPLRAADPHMSTEERTQVL